MASKKPRGGPERGFDDDELSLALAASLSEIDAPRPAATPAYDEDEELKRALALSLKDAPSFKATATFYDAPPAMASTSTSPTPLDGPKLPPAVTAPKAAPPPAPVIAPKAVPAAVAPEVPPAAPAPAKPVPAAVPATAALATTAVAPVVTEPAKAARPAASAAVVPAAALAAAPAVAAVPAAAAAPVAAKVAGPSVSPAAPAGAAAPKSAAKSAAPAVPGAVLVGGAAATAAAVGAASASAPAAAAGTAAAVPAATGTAAGGGAGTAAGVVAGAALVGGVAAAAASDDAAGQGPVTAAAAKPTSRTGLIVLLVFALLHFMVVVGLAVGGIVTQASFAGQLNQLVFDEPAVAGSAWVGSSITAMWVVVAVECVLVVLFVFLEIKSTIMSYITAVRKRSRVSPTAHQEILAFVWPVIALLILLAWFAMGVIATALNKMAYQGLWCDTGKVEQDLFGFFGGIPSASPDCTESGAVSTAYVALGFGIISVMLNTVLAFIYQPIGTSAKLAALVPAILLAAILLLFPVAMLELVFQVQRYFYLQGVFTWEPELVVALIAWILATLLSLFLAYAVMRLRLLPRISRNVLQSFGKQVPLDMAELKEMEATAGKGIGEGVPADIETGMKGDAFPDTSADQNKKKKKVSFRLGGSKKEDKDKADAAAAAASAAAAAGQPPPKRPERFMLVTSLRLVAMQFQFVAQLPTVFGFLAPVLALSSLKITSAWSYICLGLSCGLALLFAVGCWYQRRVFQNYVLSIERETLAAMAAKEAAKEERKAAAAAAKAAGDTLPTTTGAWSTGNKAAGKAKAK